MPKVSVIIPVYNAQDYLEKCLDSIVNQTLEDIEIICVNDCSTDNSLDILLKYSQNDNRIKVIDCKVNGGESKARNTGLNIATGEYLAFVDNDDTIDLDFYERLYNKAIETKAEIVKAEAHIFETDGSNKFDCMNEKIKKYNSKLFFTHYWWCAIYKKELINNNNIRLAEGYPLGGDILFLNEALLKCNHLELVDGTYYNYYRRDDSGDSKILSFDKVKSVFMIVQKIVHNTMTYTQIQNDLNGIKHIYSWCFSTLINNAYRNKTIKNLEFCVNCALQVYKKTEQYLINDDNLYKTFPIIMHYCKNGDKDSIIKTFLKYDNPQKMLIANLRFLHIKQ